MAEINDRFCSCFSFVFCVFVLFVLFGCWLFYCCSFVCFCIFHYENTPTACCKPSAYFNGIGWSWPRASPRDLGSSSMGGANAWVLITWLAWQYHRWVEKYEPGKCCTLTLGGATFEYWMIVNFMKTQREGWSVWRAAHVSHDTDIWLKCLTV